MSEKIQQEQNVLKCYHCGNETLMNKCGEYVWGSKEEGNEFFLYFTKYELFACPVCHKVTLHKTYGDEEMLRYGHNGEEECYVDEKIIYPYSNLEDNAIPHKIKEAFDATQKVQNIDNNVCLMSLRRCLEFILKEKGATKWGLKDKIEEIAAKGILPEALKEASSLAKIFGDSAAHGKEDDYEVDSHDVNSLIELVEYIIEYLYVLPYKMERLKRRIKLQEEDRLADIAPSS